MDREIELATQSISFDKTVKPKTIHHAIYSMGNKYLNDDSRLKVYVNEEDNRYYISVFTAYSLEFITYKKACNLYNNNNFYFEISPEILHVLKVIFGDKLEIIKLPLKESRFTIERNKELLSENIDSINSDYLSYDNMDDDIKKYSEMLNGYNNKRK